MQKIATHLPLLKMILLLAMPVLLVLLPVEWIDGEGMPLCVFKNLTGHECWGCGLTRAMVCAAKFDWAQAWQFNPLVVVVFPLSVVVWGVALRRTIIAFRRHN